MIECLLNKHIFLNVLLLLICVCVWGCGNTYYDWDDRRSSKRVVGFVDDSLVMIGDIRCWTKYEETILTISDEDLGSGCGHTRLCVYNYRVQEVGPRWCDSLDNTRDGSTLMGQMTDSIVWGGNVPESIKLWKIGETQHQIKLKKIIETCSGEFEITSMKQWFDGKFIARGENSLNAGGDSCQYAILDTIAKLITYKNLDDNLKWIKKCDDVRVWGNDVYCLKFDKEERTSSLFVNDNLKYILENDYFWTAGAVLQFQGNILLLERDVCRLENGKIKCFASASSSGISFKNKEDDVYITY